MCLLSTDFWQGYQDHKIENIFLTNEAETIEFPHGKQWNWTSTSHQIKNYHITNRRSKCKNYNYKTFGGKQGS